MWSLFSRVRRRSAIGIPYKGKKSHHNRANNKTSFDHYNGGYRRGHLLFVLARQKKVINRDSLIHTKEAHLYAKCHS